MSKYKIDASKSIEHDWRRTRRGCERSNDAGRKRGNERGKAGRMKESKEKEKEERMKKSKQTRTVAGTRDEQRNRREDVVMNEIKRQDI